MKNKTIMIGVGGLIALAIVWNRKEKLMDKNNKDFRDGYVAGFFTPGPFTILAVTGLAAYHA